MPDSINYSSVTLPNWTDTDFFSDLFGEIKTFMQTLEGLAIGFEIKDFTGSGSANPELQVEWLGTGTFDGWNPLADIYNQYVQTGSGSIGTWPYNLTEARTIYFRWSDGNSGDDENYYFISVVSIAPMEIRVGVLPHPYDDLVEILKNIRAGANFLNLPAINDSGVWYWVSGEPTEKTNLYDEADVDALIGTTSTSIPVPNYVAGGFRTGRNMSIRL